MSIERESFHWVDYLIFTVILTFSCAVGIYYAVTDSKKQTKDEFLMGGRKLKWLPVAISLLVSYSSAISMLGKPAEVYLHGVQFFTGTFGMAFAVVISAYTFVPLLFKLKLTSSYEYLELRFQSKAVRCVGTMLIVTSEMIFIGIATYSPAIALEAVTGFPVWASILCVGAVATFYTTLGGMKAVVWTDTFQSVVMVGGMLAVIIVGISKVGGFHNMWTINKRNGRTSFFDFSFDPTIRLSFWSLLLGRTAMFTQSFSVCQSAVQRFSSVSTLRKARLTILAILPMLLVGEILMCILGLVLYSYFSECDVLKHPDSEQRLASPNQLVPVFVMKVIGWPGIPGAFLAAIFSASLSTVSSCLSSLATVSWEDLLRWKFDYLSERTKTKILKALILIYGVCGVGMAFLISILQGSILQVALSFKYTANSPLMGIFILGAFLTKSNWLGAVVGGVVGLVFPMWMGIGSYMVTRTPPLNTSIAECEWNGTITSNFTSVESVPESIEGIKKLYTVSFLYFPVIGILTTVLVGYIVSLITRPFIKAVKPDDINKAYLIFPLDHWSSIKNYRNKEKETCNEEELKELAL